MERDDELRNEDADTRVPPRDLENAAARADAGLGGAAELERPVPLTDGGRADVPGRDIDATGAREEELRTAGAPVDTSDAARADDGPSVGDQVGEAAGGISGVIAGAAIGSIGGRSPGLSGSGAD